MAIEIKVVFEETIQRMQVDFQAPQEMQVDFGNIQPIIVNAETYTGGYEVTPKVKPQTMPTANKLMVADVQVKAIPFYEVSNLENGKTIIIGGSE